MVKLARLTGQEVITALQKAGFQVLKVKGMRRFFIRLSYKLLWVYRIKNGRPTFIELYCRLRV